MGYGREIYRTAQSLLSERRAGVRQETERRRQELSAKLPRAMELEREIAGAGFSAAQAVLRSSDIERDMAYLMRKNMALQAEFEQLLIQNGYPPDYLEPQYHCSLCSDTGTVSGGQCTCLKELMQQSAYARLNELTHFESCGLDSFRLDYYPSNTNDGVSPRMQMQTILDYCRNYAATFSLRSASILMQGPTGLGKTHLSLAIARMAIDRGYGAVYGSVQNLMARLEQERFGKSDSAEGSAQALLTCDLLILDDLGTEFLTQFVVASIYNIVNSRLLSGKPTIINTNLSMQDLNGKYTERFTSRIIGGYDRLVFMGRDIREQKRFQTR